VPDQRSNRIVQVPVDDQWGPRQWLRVRLGCLAFLGFLAYPVTTALDAHRPAPIVALNLVGLAIWAACYGRVTWVTVPDPHRLSTPYTLAGVLAVGTALVLSVGVVWLGTFAFYANAVLLLALPRRLWFWSLGAVGVGFVIGALALGSGLGETVNAMIVVVMVGVLQAAFFGKIQDAVALRLARAELARLAVDEERLRIARDLHDVLGQELTAMALKAQLSARLVSLDPARAETEIIEVERIARQALDGMRAMVSGYRDTSLASEVRTASALLGAVGVTAVAGAVPADLPPGVEEAAAWVVREAATNVVRHAKAEHCHISVDRSDGEVVVTVRDDGTAAGYRCPVPHGNGLRGLSERLTALGGRLDAGPIDGWFTVCATIPAEAVR
jgi:two-component system sensor histidine kinase DesK